MTNFVKIILNTPHREKHGYFPLIEYFRIAARTEQGSFLVTSAYRSQDSFSYQDLSSVGKDAILGHD